MGSTASIVSDTISFNRQVVESLQGDSRYDYDREFLDSDMTIWKLLGKYFARLIHAIFGDDVNADNFVIWIYLIIVLVVIFLVVRYLRKHNFLFRSRQAKNDYTVEDETIYGIDFDAELQRALAQNDMRQAVRILYLQTLKILDDNGALDWQPSKTSSQYEREMGREIFTLLTRTYIRVRYGNFSATMVDVERMKAWQKEMAEIQRKGAAE